MRIPVASAARAVATLAMAGSAVLSCPAWMPAQSTAAATEVVTDAGWNSNPALDLVSRARTRRAQPFADTALQDYSALAQGHVYFYLDWRGSAERTLIKVDQIAVEVYWAAPNMTKQRIVGMRDVSHLPNRQRYHIDHLTVVQDEFGDVMRMGDGDEVSEVPHPAAAGAEYVYDFRLVDSLTLRLPGAPEPIRVYEVEVKPKDFGQPGIIGSMFLDRAGADIVRMEFTFTPASYVDPRLDYIRVSLENALWNDRHWLPYEQRVEIRRQLPELDFSTGAVIQGVLRVDGYEFNQGLPTALFAGAPVTAAPVSAREAYPFTEGLMDGAAAFGLAPPPPLEVVRRRAIEIAGRNYLSGLPRLRLHIPGASSVLRYNRAEGLYIGAGVTYAPQERARFELLAGQATSLGGPTLDAGFRYETAGGLELSARAYQNSLEDIGPLPGAPGVLNSLAGAITASDYLDPYLAEGFGVEIDAPVGSAWRAALSLSHETHENGRIAGSSILRDNGRAFRPIRSVYEGRVYEAQASLRRTDGDISPWSGGVSLVAGSADGETYAQPVLEISRSRRSFTDGINVDARLFAGTTFGTAPPQRTFLLGGRGSVPGYQYRTFAGHTFALAQVEAWRAVVPNLVNVRAVGAAGWTDLGDRLLPADWDVTATDGVRTSVGLGVGVFFDMIRFDVVRGLNRGGRWEAVLSVNPSLRDVL